MTLPRISIAVLMVIVVIIAVDIATIRELMHSNWQITVKTMAITTIGIVVFALGVLPMASLLAIAAVIGFPKRSRGGVISSRLLGFQLFGWASVALFIILSVISTSSVITHVEVIVLTILPLLAGAIRMPEWASLCLELGLASILFTVPELLIALFGGWLIGRLGRRYASSGMRLSRQPTSPTRLFEADRRFPSTAAVCSDASPSRQDLDQEPLP